MREFNAASLSLRRGSSSAAIADCAPEEPDTPWGSGWFGTHKTATNQVRLSAAPQRPPSDSKRKGRGRAILKKHKLRGRKVMGPCSKSSPFPWTHPLNALAAPAVTIC